MTQLLSTAPTLPAIKESICAFYVGTSMTLIPAGNDEWKLVRTSDGKQMDGVRVLRRRNRFRFEMF